MNILLNFLRNFILTWECCELGIDRDIIGYYNISLSNILIEIRNDFLKISFTVNTSYSDYRI